MNDKEKYMKSFDKFLKLGFWKFSLLNGVVWGVFTYIIFRVLISFDQDAETFDWNTTLLQLVIWIVMGILFVGPFMWFLVKRQYKKGLKKFN